MLGTDHLPAYPPMTLEATTAGGGRVIRLAAGRSRPSVFLTDLAEDVGAHLVPVGSAGAKIAAVVTGEVDAYIHAGGQYEWDSAAPVAVATATALHASRIDGSALRYNEADPRLPDLLVCRKDLASRLLAALQSIPGSLSVLLYVSDRKGLESHERIRANRGRVMTTSAAYQVSHLDALEAESVFVMREVVAEMERPVLLFS
ncbi:inositol monophosphatase family protein, partial [Micromonospora rubida]